MKLNVYAIFDSAAVMYERPVCFRADGEAMRFFENLCLNAESPVAKHPEDFSFYKIATYDDNKGEIESLTKMCMCTAEEIVAKSREIAPGSLKAVDQSYGGTA